MGKLIIFEIFSLFCAFGVLCDKGMVVENEPTIEGTGDPRVKAVIGDDALFNCIIKNLGNFSISWMKDEKIIAVGNDSVTHDRIVARHRPSNGWYTLEILDLRWEDGGNYTCQIGTNPPRQILYTLKLGDPKFVSANQTFRVTRGETFVLPCEIKNLDDFSPYWDNFDEDGGLPRWMIYAKQSSQYSIFWDPNIFKIVDGSNLEIRNVSDEVSGKWVCGLLETDLLHVIHRLEVVDNNRVL